MSGASSESEEFVPGRVWQALPLSATKRKWASRVQSGRRVRRVRGRSGEAELQVHVNGRWRAICKCHARRTCSTLHKRPSRAKCRHRILAKDCRSCSPALFCVCGLPHSQCCKEAAKRCARNGGNARACVHKYPGNMCACRGGAMCPMHRRPVERCRGFCRDFRRNPNIIAEVLRNNSTAATGSEHNAAEEDLFARDFSL